MSDDSHSNSDDDINDEIDCGWMTEFKKLEESYEEFYKEPPSTVKLYFLFIDSGGEAKSIKRDNVKLDKNSILTKDKIIDVMFRNNPAGSMTEKYNLKTILQYNFTIDAENIYNVINKDDYQNEYLRKYSYVQDIKFNNTIKAFHSVNSLFFILKMERKGDNHTRKCRYTGASTGILAKKHRFHKTRRILGKKCI
uniref:Uncharacterized protein n=1 Tax=viral metagenome TaxID=1070528 RepID=A0A6C0BYA5_9ZZZZ